MVESPSGRSMFSTRSQHARIHAAAALEAAGFRCAFTNVGDDLFLLAVEHERHERETVRQIVFGTEPGTIVGID